MRHIQQRDPGASKVREGTDDHPRNKNGTQWGEVSRYPPRRSEFWESERAREIRRFHETLGPGLRG
jgi:hypothetical protein